jgi:hypothetical protein
MTNNAKVTRITDGSAMPPKLLLRQAQLAGLFKGMGRRQRHRDGCERDRKNLQRNVNSQLVACGARRYERDTNSESLQHLEAAHEHALAVDRHLLPISLNDGSSIIAFIARSRSSRDLYTAHDNITVSSLPSCTAWGNDVCLPGFTSSAMQSTYSRAPCCMAQHSRKRFPGR